MATWLPSMAFRCGLRRVKQSACSVRTAPESPAPKLATLETYRKLGGIPVNGPYAASVPGAVAGFDLAWKKYGSLDYATLLPPRAGDLFVQADLGRTLETIAREGADVF